MKTEDLPVPPLRFKAAVGGEVERLYRHPDLPAALPVVYGVETL